MYKGVVKMTDWQKSGENKNVLLFFSSLVPTGPQAIHDINRIQKLFSLLLPSFTFVFFFFFFLCVRSLKKKESIKESSILVVS